MPSPPHAAPSESDERHPSLQVDCDPIRRWLVVPADRAARAIVRAVAHRRREVVVTGHGKLIVWLARHLPSVLAFALKRGAYRSRGEPTPVPR